LTHVAISPHCRPNKNRKPLYFTMTQNKTTQLGTGTRQEETSGKKSERK
jgi:hypothetical protein